MLYNAHFVLKFGWISIKFERVIHNISKKYFVTLPGKTGNAIKLKLFSGIHLLLKVFHFEAFVNRIADKGFMSKSTSKCDFRRELFFIGSYRQSTTMLILFLQIFDII